MHGYTGIKNDDQLFMAITSDIELQNQLNSLNSKNIPTKAPNQQRVLNEYCKGLVNLLNQKLRMAGITNGDFFEDVFIFDSKNNAMQINFSSEAYAVNKFNTHVSFMPVLYNYGWELNKKKTASLRKNPGRMSFAYYAGSYFITEAIEEFNKNQADKNIYAKFMYGDTNLTLYQGNGKLPYIQRYL